MPKDEGTGGSLRDRFFYNSATTECERFSYSGTGGNANNFENKLQCESYCKTGTDRMWLILYVSKVTEV